MSGTRKQGFREVAAGHHIVFIYEDRLDLMKFAVPYTKAGLAEGERCLFVIEDRGRDLPAFTCALAAGGVDVDRESRRGALAFLTGDEFAGPPPFDPLRLVDLIRGRVTEAYSRGFSGLRIAGQMTWTLAAQIPDRALMEFEMLLERAAGSGPFTVACMFRRDRFDQELLRQLVRSNAHVTASHHVFLSLCPLFQNLPKAGLQGLAQLARERNVPRGGFFFHQGDAAPDVYLLTSGAGKILRTDAEGRSVVLRIVKPLEPFAERGLLGTTRLSSAQALEDSEALILDAPAVDQVILRNPAVSLNTIRLMEETVATERSRLEDLATSAVERRLARFLLRLAQSIAHWTVAGLAMDISLSGQDLAELVIATPYSISRVLADWRRLHIADARRDRILILDLDRLAAIAGVRDHGDLSKIGGRGGSGGEESHPAQKVVR